MKNDYYVGQIVELLVDHPDNNKKLRAGDFGIVCNVEDFEGEIIGVNWQRNIDGHSCSGTCEFGKGWNVGVKDIMPTVADDDDDIALNDALFNASFLMFSAIEG